MTAVLGRVLLPPLWWSLGCGQGRGGGAPGDCLPHQVELEEAQVRRRAAVRTLGQQARVWSVRLLLNLLVAALLGAAFYGVYWATGSTEELQVCRGPRRGAGVLGPTFPRAEGS